MDTKREVLIGGVIGIIIAVLAIALAELNSVWDNKMLQSGINFAASVPTLILDAKLNLPQMLQNILFFGYWMAVGAVIALLMTSKNPAFKISAVICLIALIFIHRAVQINLERELEDALRALGEIFAGKVK